MIKINKSEKIPITLSKKGKEETEKLKKEYDKGVRSFTFSKAIYGAPSVKSQLKEEQFRKCCFCESINRAYEDVEHFRPKGAWMQKEGEALSETGYYWLAYDWSNLLFSCKVCNISFKKNHFPLSDASNRTINHHGNLELEEVLLINPSLEDPEDHIYFKGVDPFAHNNSKKGVSSINILGLRVNDSMSKVQRVHAEELHDRRMHLYETLKQVYILATKAFPEELRVGAQALLAKAQQPNAEYSLMIKCALKDEFKYGEIHHL